MSEEIEYDKLIGGYPFTSESIDFRVKDGLTGVYLLSKGDRSPNGKLFVDYVGRAIASDTEDLRKRLRAHLNSDDEQVEDDFGEKISIYKYFWYYVEKTEEDAYKRECKDFHLYGSIRTLLNKIHPAKRPGFPDDKCPVAGCKG